MGVESLHPLYAARLDDWVLLEDCYEGERRIKAQGDRYLPPTSAMRANGYGQSTGLGRVSQGQAAYDAYRLRAVFPDDLRKAVTGMVGVMHRKPPAVEDLPPALEPMLERMTIDGESWHLLWKRITAAQLLDGRCGLAVDVPDGASVADALPYVVLYGAQAVRNWDAGRPTQSSARRDLQLVVLDETSFELSPDMQWTPVVRFRVMSRGARLEQLGLGGLPDAYVTALVDQNGELSAAPWVAPSIAGNFLREIPFVFVNPNDLVPEPDVPPFLGLANQALAVYRGEADYRQGLHLQSQDTLVRIGGDADERDVALGAGALIDVPIGGDAKFIGVSATGLSEQRECLQNDRAKMGEQSMEGLDVGGSADQSGEALRVRVSARTATLTSMQQAAAGAIRDCLIHAGRFMGVGEDLLQAIVVKPNTDFSDARVDAASVNALMDARSKGLPLSDESIHAFLQRNEYTTLSFEEEQRLILARAQQQQSQTEPA
jgi:hypothetical protein